MRVRDEPFNPTSVINDDKGTPIFNTTKAKERWKEYFRELLNPTGENTEESPYIPPTPDNDDCPILESEVERTILDSPKNKAPGPDGITADTIRATGTIGVKWLHRIFKTAWKNMEVPEDWQKAVIIPIWKKKGNKRDCGTYRGISLLSHSGKIYAKILERRLRPIVDPQLSHCQFGFRRNKGCTDAIFTLRQMCEKAIEFDKDLNIVFVDQEKAFDRVNRNTLWKVLEKYGTDKQLLRNIMAFYEQSQGAVRTTSGLTEWFKINSGVRQGCVLSPLLFIAYMDNITQDAKRTEENETGAIRELLFADDQSLISEDHDALQDHTSRLNTSCKNANMKISIAKTEAMNISRDPKTLVIDIDGHPIKQVNEFKYLGSMFSSDGKIDREIETRIQKANKVTYQIAPLLTNQHIEMNVKRQIISSIFVPTLTYQCQSWTLTNPLKSKIQACEMRCLRKTINVTRRDRYKNNTIRTLIGTEPLQEYINRQQIKWFGHIIRMMPNETPSIAYTSRHSGRKARGRPRKRWIDGIKETLNTRNMTVTEATQLAHHRRLHLPSTPHVGNRGRKK